MGVGLEINMKVVIVDDNVIFAQNMAELIRLISQENKYIYEVECLEDGRELLCRLPEKRWADVYFLDVEIGNINGMDIAQEIRNVDRKTKIVFVTSHEKYAIQGYTYKAEGYILKSECSKQLPRILKEIWEDNLLNEKRKYTISSERRHEMIYYDDLLYVEKDSRESKNVTFVLMDGRGVVERIAIREVLKKLPEAEFMLISRKHIVNMRHITKLLNDSVEVDGRYNLEISRTLLGELRDKLTKYWGRI